MMPDQPKSIDEAISICDTLVEHHKQSGRRLLYIVYAITVTLIILFAYLLIMPDQTDEPDARFKLSDMAVYAFLVIYTLSFAILMSLYRLHLNEASKAFHFKIGFLRIRIAANNEESGFQSEVRASLTTGAFDYIPIGKYAGNKEKIESPIQGHPTSDLSASVLNKLLDKIDINIKKDK